METAAYLKYFQLEEQPFNLTPDPHFYCELDSSYEAFETLKFAIDSGSAISLLEGDIGTGKTFLCRRLLREINQDKYYPCYIPNPQYSNSALRHAIAHELSINEAALAANQQDVFTAINHRLLEIANTGKVILLIVDEAQNLTVENLEFIRLLTNLETEEKKLVQVVLFAQTEIQAQLSKSELRQLRQRIAFHYKLLPMPKAAVGKYLAQRLVSANHPTGILFTKKAVQQLHHYSRGVPRLINILADKALMASFARDGACIKRKDIMQAAKNSSMALSSASQQKKTKLVKLDIWFGLASIIVLIVGLLLILFELGIIK